MDEWMDGWMIFMDGLYLQYGKEIRGVKKMGEKVNVIENVPCIIDQDYQR